MPPTDKSVPKGPTDEELIERMLRLFVLLLQYSGTPTNTQNTTDYPSWCLKIVQRLDSTILKSLQVIQPKDGHMSLRNCGRLFGILKRTLFFIKHEMAKQLKDIFPEEKLTPDEINQMISEYSEIFNPYQWLYEKAMLEGSQLTPIQQKEFYQGFAEGLSMFLNEDGQLTGERERISIYLILWILHPEIEKMRNERLTRKKLLEWLADNTNLSLRNSDTEDWFSDVCDDIGLSLKRPGCPKKDPLK